LSPTAGVADGQERNEQVIEDLALVERVAWTIDRYHLLPRGQGVLVAVSGGLDSVCLLSLLRRLAPGKGVRLTVAHLNHGLRPEAQQEAHFVQALCARWGVPCHCGSDDVRAMASERQVSLETAARQARYTFLASLARRLGIPTIAVGHHADDQAETVLLHLLRGTGLLGLGGMRPLSRLDDELEEPGAKRAPGDEPLRLIRPLLGVSRSELEAWARARGIEAMEDGSNADTVFIRNRIRHQLLPLLENYNPSIRKVLGRTAESLAGDYQLVEQTVDRIWPSVASNADSQAVYLDREAFCHSGEPLQRALLRRAVEVLQGSTRDLQWVHVADALQALMQYRPGARIALGRWEIFTGYESLRVAAPDGPWPATVGPQIGAALVPAVPGTVTLPGSPWRLHVCLDRPSNLPEPLPGQSSLHAWLDADRLAWPLLLRPRRPGDRLWPSGMRGSSSVKELLIDKKIPAASRDGLPILQSGEQVAWVVGVRLAGRYLASPSSRRLLHLWFEPLQAHKEC
jgi:tRNA(Ile)-lysidine synthase